MVEDSSAGIEFRSTCDAGTEVDILLVATLRSSTIIMEAGSLLAATLRSSTIIMEAGSLLAATLS